MYGASGEEGPSGAPPGGGAPPSAPSPISITQKSPAQVHGVPPGMQPQMFGGMTSISHSAPTPPVGVQGAPSGPAQPGMMRPPAPGVPGTMPMNAFTQPAQMPMMMGSSMYPMVSLPGDGTQVRPNMMPMAGSFGPSIVRTTPLPGASSDAKLPPTALPVTQPRPTPRPGGARRGRPPRNAQRNQGQIVYAGSPPAPPADSKQFTPALSLPQQQALLARAMQMAKQQGSPTYTPAHALAQMGFVFVRGAQAPQVPNSMLGGDGTILRMDEATSLGLIPQRPAGPIPAAISTPQQSSPFGQAESILPPKSAVGLPVTPMNTRVSRVSEEPKLDAKDEKELRRVMDQDAAFSALFAKQHQMADTELRKRAVVGELPWFLKPALDSRPGQPLSIVFPSQRRDGNKMRPALGKGTLAVADRPTMLVPIRLEIEHEPYKLRDTFVWNAAEDDKALEVFATTLCDDFGLPPSVFVELIRDSVHSQVAEYVSEHALFPRGHDSGRGHLAVDSLKEWESIREEALGGATAPLPPHAADLHVQSTTNTITTTTTQDDDQDSEPEADLDEPAVDLRILIKLDILVGGMSLVDQFEWDLLSSPEAADAFAAAFTADLGLAGEFTTAVSHSIREQVSTHIRSLFLLGYPLNGFELLDEEIRSAFLPHVESEHVMRTPGEITAFTPRLQQLSSIDVARLERERERDMRRKRRQTKGRRVVGLPDREPQRTFRTPPIWGLQGAGDTISVRRGAVVDDTPTATKRVRTDWYDLHFVFPGGLGLPRNAPQQAPRYRPELTRSQAGGALGTAPPSMAIDVPAAPRGRPPKARQPVNAWDAALAKGARREDLERQHPNLHDGRWYCGNCGCPDVLAPGRRKGPLGEKTLCGPCGKYFHQHRRMEVVEYTRDPEKHVERLRRLGMSVNEADAVAMMSQSTGSVTNMHGTENDDAYVPFEESDSDDSDNGSSDGGTQPALSTHEAAPPAASEPHTRPSHPNLPSIGRGPPPAPTPPQWLQRALSICRAKYPADRFWEIARPADDGSGAIEWRIRCADCPGKLYKLGPGDSLSNFEIHLKNRSHRAAVAARLGAAQ
ncbi:SWI/SNF chromatin-remodeling complex subunit [Malassezia cuniculi]|uniref:SWI/SNF chromatin-remodeling complex subunit n=1 Tax=Malassezia cuniculi TaxID=948313 RepID=A0AAF0EYC9_9BASI|nr:SWI/SNF chromatin-remodeling complex subunit [Malassezia cuniculi]